MRVHDIAVVGASGLVGRKILELIQERKFEVGKIVAIASDASAGKELNIKGKTFRLEAGAKCIQEPRICILQRRRLHIYDGHQKQQ
jgi:aspartate-semialdehyde dehydrogenase